MYYKMLICYLKIYNEYNTYLNYITILFISCLLEFRWTYADSSWARIAALVPVVVSCAEAGDQIADEILSNAVQELALSVTAVVQRLHLAGEGVFSYIFA